MTDETAWRKGTAVVPKHRADDASFDSLLRELARVSEPPGLHAGCALRPGSTLAGGRLSIVQPLGQGGMGSVYEVFDVARNAHVALKTLTRVDASGLYRLKNEFRALAHVRHPNVVRLYDLFADGALGFFTMELIRGQPFDRWVRPCREPSASDPASAPLAPLDEARLRSALPQLLAGIEAVHAAGKLHRDLKPSNVLVTAAGRLVLLDFGLAADPQPGGVGQTVNDDALSGTPAYMAPEQTQGAAACAASDRYAFGVMLFEALTGGLPFVGGVADILRDKQRCDAPPVGQLFPQVPADLAECCDALLQRDPAARPDAQALRTMVGAGGLSAAIGLDRGPPCMQLIGRERELEALRRAYDATRTDRAVVVFVHGESGIGKSALVAQALAELRVDPDVVVLSGRCYERESVPFKGIDSVLDELSRFLRRLPPEEVAALLPRDVHPLMRTFPVLERVKALARAPAARGGTAQDLRERAFAAFIELVARVRDRRPLVVYVDDAQWLDRDGVALLDVLLAQREPVPLLLVLAHRSLGADAAPLGAIRRRIDDNRRVLGIEVEVGPLTREAARALAQHWVGCADDAACAQLAEESLGSPFLLNALTRRWGTTQPRALTLQAALLAHVHACSAAAARVIELLALAARPLPAAQVLAAAQANHDALDELHSARLLESRGAGELRVLACYHDQIRESVLEALPTARARVLHARLFSVLRGCGGSEPEHLALHAEGAGELAVAAHYCELAGEGAAHAMAFERAASLYRRALELGEHDGTARRALLLKLGEALANAGRGADAAQAFLDAARGLSATEAFECKRRAAEQLLMSGHVDAGRAVLNDVLGAVGLSLPSSPRRALVALGWERMRLQLRGRSFRVRSRPLPEVEARALQALRAAATLYGVDLFANAMLNARYTRLALDSGLPEHASFGLMALGYTLVAERGTVAADEAAELFARSEALAVESGVPDALVMLAGLRATAALFLGGIEGPIVAQCERALELAREVPEGWQLRCVIQAILNTYGELFGRLRPVAELSEQVEEAFRRGDLYAAILLLQTGTAARLWQGDRSGHARQLAHARAAWNPPHTRMFLDASLLLASVQSALFEGNARGAFDALQAAWPSLERSGLLRVQVYRLSLLSQRAVAAFHTAQREPDNARAFRALVRRDVRAFAKLRLPFAQGPRQALLGLHAIMEHRIEDAVAHQRAAITESDRAGMLPQAATARCMLGELLGGDEGAALIVEGRAALQRIGVTELDAHLHLMASSPRVRRLEAHR